MKSFKKFVESCKSINEAEYNKEWWDSKSDSFKKRYIEKHPNSIYAQKSRMTPNQKKEVSKFVDKAFGKNSKAAKTTYDNLSDSSTKKTQRKSIKADSKEQDKTSNTKYDNTKASLSKKLGSKKYQQLEDFISDYDVEQYSKVATEYAYDVSDGPDDVENHFEDFDDIYYVNGSELARNIKKKFGFDIPHHDLENILDKVGGQNVVQWETDGSEKSVVKKPSTPKFGPTASKFSL